MSVIHFGGEGKQRGECGVKRGGSAVPFLGEEGTPRRCACMLEVASAAVPSVARGRRSWAGPMR
jgi:hypothetical protein